MRVPALLFTALLLSATALDAAPRPKAFFDYVPAAHGKPVVYTVDGVTIRITNKKDAEDPDFLQPVFEISAKGMKPLRMEGETSLGSYAHNIAVGRLNKGDTQPSIILQSYSGGAHCCTGVDVAVPMNGTYKIVSVGSWDGEGMTEFPTDISGDGVADFQFLDNAFLYAFGSYADSWAPPLIMNVVNGKAVNVSTNPAFRKVFEADLAAARKQCVAPVEKDSFRNGACAAYGANAARLGRYPAARAEIVKHHQKGTDWDLPTDCSVPVPATGCPEGKEITYASFPLALDAFLKQNGYLSGR